MVNYIGFSEIRFENCYFILADYVFRDLFVD